MSFLVRAIESTCVCIVVSALLAWAVGSLRFEWILLP